MILLSDGYLANGAEPWRLPDVDDAARHRGRRSPTEPNHIDADGEPEFWPYLRDPETLARPWAVPGTPGLSTASAASRRRTASGNISYDPANHERMVDLRAAKVAGIANDIPAVEVDGDADDAELLVSAGARPGAPSTARVDRVRGRGQQGRPGPPAHLNPFPRNLGEVLRRYPKVLVPEMNLGQLSQLVRAEFLVDARSVNKVQGVPFTAGEIETRHPGGAGSMT